MKFQIRLCDFRSTTVRVILEGGLSFVRLTKKDINLAASNQNRIRVSPYLRRGFDRNRFTLTKEEISPGGYLHGTKSIDGVAQSFRLMK